MARARQHDAAAQRARLRPTGRAAGGVAGFIHQAFHLIRLGLIAAFPVLNAAVMNRLPGHDRRPAVRKAPPAPSAGAPDG